MDRSTLGFLLNSGLGSTGLIGVFLLVMIQVGGCSKCMTTGLTLVWFLTSMNTLMNFQVWLLREILPTVLAFELLGSLVIFADVTFEISSAGKLHAAKGTLSCTSCVTMLVPHMLVESSLPPAPKVTLLAFEVFASVMLLGVLSQAGLPVTLIVTLRALVLYCFVKGFFVTFQQLWVGSRKITS